MPRSPQQNTRLREARREQILNAALAVYIRCGYHGTDMDDVARQAGLAKGLVYYYYKAKKDLFAALYTHMFNDGAAFTEAVLAQTRGLAPLRRLARYTHAMFLKNRQNPYTMPFYMRAPFDAAAVFGRDAWQDGAGQSAAHHRALAGIIADAMAEGRLPEGDANRLATSFWTVFVGSLFDYSKLVLGRESPALNDKEAFAQAVCFAFRGLGAQEAQWRAEVAAVTTESETAGKEEAQA